MPKIQFTCSNCQTKYSALPDQAGQRGLCKNCGAIIKVPKSEHKHIVKGTKRTESNLRLIKSLKAKHSEKALEDQGLETTDLEEYNDDQLELDGKSEKSFMQKLGYLENRVQQLIEKGQQTQGTKKNSGDGHDYVENRPFSEFRAASLSFLERTFGSKHAFTLEFREKVTQLCPDHVEDGLGILAAAKDEIQGGWLFTTKEIVSAEIFSDFIEMAACLLGEQCKEAAAVIGGSVLEEHLRQLCNKNGIAVEIIGSGKSVPKKADSLNSELASANIYTKLNQISVTSWLDLRNKAAHGKYSEYNATQVELMLNGLTDFIARFPL